MITREQRGTQWTIIGSSAVLWFVACSEAAPPSGFGGAGSMQGMSGAGPGANPGNSGGSTSGGSANVNSSGSGNSSAAGGTAGGAGSGVAGSGGMAAAPPPCGAVTCEDGGSCCTLTEQGSDEYEVCTPMGGCTSLRTAWATVVAEGADQPCGDIEPNAAGWKPTIGELCTTTEDCCSGNCMAWSAVDGTVSMRCGLPAPGNANGGCTTRNDCDAGMVCCARGVSGVCATSCEAVNPPAGGAGGTGDAGASNGGAPAGGSGVGGSGVGGGGQ